MARDLFGLQGLTVDAAPAAGTIVGFTDILAASGVYLSAPSTHGGNAEGFTDILSASGVYLPQVSIGPGNAEGFIDVLSASGAYLPSSGSPPAEEVRRQGGGAARRPNQVPKRYILPAAKTSQKPLDNDVLAIVMLLGVYLDHE